MSKIVDLTASPSNLELRNPFEVAFGVQYEAPNVVVTVETDTGVIGYGESSPDHYLTGETQAATVNVANTTAELLHGRDIRNYRTLIDDVANTFPGMPSVLFAVETAIIDAYCREKELPLAELFGAHPRKIETDLTIPIVPPETASERALNATDEGFTSLKVKTGSDLMTDIERVRAVQNAAPNAELKVDANQGWSVSETVKFDDAMRDLSINLKLIEQPVSKTDIRGLAATRKRTHVPIAADESVFTPADAIRVIREDAADIINVKLGKSGILGSAEIAAIAQAADRDLMIGCMLESAVGIHTSAHLVSGLGSFSYVDLDAMRLLADDAVAEQAGPMITPDGPGHGIETDS